MPFFFDPAYAEALSATLQISIIYAVIIDPNAGHRKAGKN
jgi:hypothetical protein